MKAQRFQFEPDPHRSLIGHGKPYLQGPKTIQEFLSITCVILPFSPGEHLILSRAKYRKVPTGSREARHGRRDTPWLSKQPRCTTPKSREEEELELEVSSQRPRVPDPQGLRFKNSCPQTPNSLPRPPASRPASPHTPSPNRKKALVKKKCRPNQPNPPQPPENLIHPTTNIKRPFQTLHHLSNPHSPPLPPDANSPFKTPFQNPLPYPQAIIPRCCSQNHPSDLHIRTTHPQSRTTPHATHHRNNVKGTKTSENGQSEINQFCGAENENFMARARRTFRSVPMRCATNGCCVE